MLPSMAANFPDDTERETKGTIAGGRDQLTDLLHMLHTPNTSANWKTLMIIGNLHPYACFGWLVPIGRATDAASILSTHVKLVSCES